MKQNTTTSEPIQRVLHRLERVEEYGDSFMASCPSHDDRNPSLSISQGDDGRVLLHCFAGCELDEILDTIGLTKADLFTQNNHRGCTLEEYSEAKRLPLDFLQHELGLTDGKFFDNPYVRMPYFDTEAQAKTVRLRLSLNGSKNFHSPKSSKLIPYGLQFLNRAQENNFVLVVEGESDTQTALYHKVPVIGIPGAESWRDKWAHYFDGIGSIYMVREPDKGGDTLWEKMSKSPLRDRLYQVTLPEKDISALHLSDPDRFKDRLKQAIREAVPAKESSATRRKITTAAKLMAVEFEPVRWAVPDIVPEGVTILAGAPKMGKSWLVLGLGIATASGGYALGKKRVEKGTCLYLALEDNPRRLQRRLKKLLNGEPAPADLHITTEWPRLDEGGVDELEGWLQDNPDTRLVVIDTLKKIRPRTSGKRGVYDTDYEALEPLLPLAAKYKVSIVVVHHLRQMAAADPLEEISGSSGLTGGVDGALVLKRDRGRADACLHVTGRDVEEDAELALNWDQTLASWTLVGNAEEFRMSEQRQSIIQALREAGQPMGAKEIAGVTGIEYQTARQRLFQMNNAGEVQKVARGKYSLPTIHNNDNNDNNDNSHNNDNNGYSDSSGDGAVTDDNKFVIEGFESDNKFELRIADTYTESSKTVTDVIVVMDAKDEAPGTCEHLNYEGLCIGCQERWGIREPE